MNAASCSYARVEQALAHQRRAKQRFLETAPAPSGPLSECSRPKRTRRSPTRWRASHERVAAAAAGAAPGDVVALVAPASPFETEEFDAGVAELATLGFNPEWHHDLFARRRYVAGPAATRADDFLRAWQDPRVAGLFARARRLWQRTDRLVP